MNQNLCCMLNGEMVCSHCYKMYCAACEKKCPSHPTDDRQQALVCIDCGHYLTMTERAMWQLMEAVQKWKKENDW